VSETKTHDVLIIGAGVHGCSLANYLARQKADVGVIERAFPAAGTTGATVAAVSAATREKLSYALFIEKSKDLYRVLVEDLELDIHYEPCGMLWIFMTEQALQQGRRVIEQNRQAGLDIRFLSRAELREVEPALSTDHILGAGLAASDGQVDPFLLLRGMAHKAVKRGAHFYYHTEAMKITPRAGCIEVQTTRGLFQAGKLIIAAGIWSPLVTQSM
jgi:sarcosine oxidase subunit beta